MTNSGTAWKTRLAAASRDWQAWLVYLVVPLLAGYAVSWQAFTGKGTFPIDLGDEPAETFIQVPMAQAHLTSGHLLKMNLFDNFGTPIA